MQQQEELAKNEFKLKKQANFASVKNAFINLDKNGGGGESVRTLSSQRQTTGVDSEEEDEIANLMFNSTGNFANANERQCMTLDQSAPVHPTKTHPYSTKNRPGHQILFNKPPQGKSTVL